MPHIFLLAANLSHVAGIFENHGGGFHLKVTIKRHRVDSQTLFKLYLRDNVIRFCIDEEFEIVEGFPCLRLLIFQLKSTFLCFYVLFEHVNFVVVLVDVRMQLIPKIFKTVEFLKLVQRDLLLGL